MLHCSYQEVDFEPGIDCENTNYGTHMTYAMQLCSNI